MTEARNNGPVPPGRYGTRRWWGPGRHTRPGLNRREVVVRAAAAAAMRRSQIDARVPSLGLLLHPFPLLNF